MGRAVNGNLQALLDLQSCNTQTTLDIIPVGEDPIYVATDAFTANSHSYAADLQRADSLQQSIGASTNRVRVEVDNVDKIFGGVLMTEDLVKAEAVLGRFYRNETTVKSAPNTGEWRELFRGMVMPIELNESLAVLEIVSDLTAAGFCVGDWSLDDPCQSVFKHAGTCGYSGGLTTCNKKRRSIDGCEGRTNEHRFGGMEFPDIQIPYVPTEGGDTGDPGWPDPGGGHDCPRVDQFVAVRGADGGLILKVAGEITTVDWLWNPLKHRFYPVRAATIMPGAPIWYVASSNFAAGYSSFRHPLIANEGDGCGTAASKLRNGSDVLTQVNGELCPSKLLVSMETPELGDVVRIEIDAENMDEKIYCYGAGMSRLFVCHNSKPLIFF